MIFAISTFRFCSFYFGANRREDKTSEDIFDSHATPYISVTFRHHGPILFYNYTFFMLGTNIVAFL